MTEKKITVSELIEILKTMPQDIPVVSIDGCEERSFLKEAGIDVVESHYRSIWNGGGLYSGPYLFLAGY